MVLAAFPKYTNRFFLVLLTLNHLPLSPKLLSFSRETYKYSQMSQPLLVPRPTTNSLEERFNALILNTSDPALSMGKDTLWLSAPLRRGLSPMSHIQTQNRTQEECLVWCQREYYFYPFTWPRHVASALFVTEDSSVENLPFSNTTESTDKFISKFVAYALGLTSTPLKYESIW